MNLDDLKKHILVHLGGSRVAVELSDDDLNESIRHTLLLYSKYKPYRVLEPIQLTSTFTEKLPPEEDIYGVINVDLVANYETMGYETDAFLFTRVPIWQSRSPRFTWTLVEYDLMKKWINLTGRILDAHPDWHFDRYQRKLWIWMPSGGGKGTITWIRPYRFPEEIPNILPNDIFWFQEFALAEAKEILGRIRSKYDSIPGGGENFTLDGKDLIAEAREEKDKLLEQLINTTPDLSLWIK